MIADTICLTSINLSKLDFKFIDKELQFEDCFAINLSKLDFKSTSAGMVFSTTLL